MRMNTSGSKLSACLLAACLLAGAAGCSPKAEEASAAAKEIYVETAAPGSGDLSLTTEFIGTVEPDELVSVFPKVAGTVLAVHKNVGDEVKKGDLLFEIDPSDIQLSVNIAQAQLMSAQAQMDQALGSSFDMQMIQLESQLKQAQNAYSNARKSLRDYNDGAEDAMDELAGQQSGLREKIKGLEERVTASQESLKALEDAYPGEAPIPPDDVEKIASLKAQIKIDQNMLADLKSNLGVINANYNDLDDGDSATHSQLRAAVRNAQTAYESAEQIYELTKDAVHNDAIKVAKAGLGQATAAFEAQARQLEYTRVTSPIDGVIEQKNVSEQGVASQSSPAFTVSNKSTLMVTFYVPADAAGQMASGDRVTIENGRLSCPGTIAEVGTMVDPATGLFKVKAAADGEGAGLLTGLAVKVTAETAKARGSLLVPQSVVYYEDGAPYVYLLEDGHAVKTFIETGIANEKDIEVLSGLDASSRIISTWNPYLTDGAAVAVSGGQEAEGAAPAEEPAPDKAPAETSGASGEEAESGASGAAREG